MRHVKRAQILLAAHAGVTDEQIARSVRVGASTMYRVKRRFVEGGVEHALHERQRPGASRKLTGKQEALLVATACSTPPKGRARWTLQLLADELVRLTEHEDLSRETVRRRLEERELKPWQQRMWCIPKVDAEYVARMEDVLELYAEPPDAKRPVVCFDETPTQQSFPPQEARRILKKLEFHFVPKHASWLNMMEIGEGDLVRLLAHGIPLHKSARHADGLEVQLSRGTGDVADFGDLPAIDVQVHSDLLGRASRELCPS